MLMVSSKEEFGMSVDSTNVGVMNTRQVNVAADDTRFQRDVSQQAMINSRKFSRTDDRPREVPKKANKPLRFKKLTSSIFTNSKPAKKLEISPSVLASKSGIAKSFGRHFPTGLAASTLNHAFTHALETSPKLKKLVEDIVVNQGFQFCIGEGDESFADAIQKDQILLPASLKNASVDTIIGEIVHKVALMSINSEINSFDQEQHLASYLQVKSDILFTELSLLHDLVQNDPDSIVVDVIDLHDNFRSDNAEFAAAFDAFWDSQGGIKTDTFPISFNRPYVSRKIVETLVANDGDFYRSAQANVASEYAPPAVQTAPTGEPDNPPQIQPTQTESESPARDVDASKGFFEVKEYNQTIALFAKVHDLDHETAEQAAESVMEYAMEKLDLTVAEAVVYVLDQLPEMANDIEAGTLTKTESSVVRNDRDEPQTSAEFIGGSTSETREINGDILQTSLPAGMTKGSNAEETEPVATLSRPQTPVVTKLAPQKTGNLAFDTTMQLWETGNIWNKDKA